MQTPTDISIAAKRWFQKSYGNTYHRVHVLVEYADKTRKLLDSGIHYGYDEQYIQTAIEEMIKHGVLEDTGKSMDYWPFSLWCENNGVKLHTLVADVNRERELKTFVLA